MRATLVLCLLLFTVNAFAQNNYHIEQVWQKSFSGSDASDSKPTHIIEFNGSVFFIANDNDAEHNSIAGTRHLFKLDPKTNQFSVIKFSDQQPTHSITDLVVFNEELYFKQNSQAYKLLSDGVKSVAKSNFVFTVQDSVLVADKLYLVGDYGKGRELYVVKGDQPELITDINPGNRDGVISDLALYRGDLYFSATDGSNHSLYKLSPNDDSLTVVTRYSKSDNISIPSVVANSEYLFYSVAGEDTKVTQYNGSTKKVIYQESAGLNQLGVAGNNLLVHGKTLGSSCQAQWHYDFAYVATLVDLSNNTASCIWMSSPDGLVDALFNYHFDEKYLVLDTNESVRSMFTINGNRVISKVDLKDKKTSLLYQYTDCPDIPEQGFRCEVNNYSSVIINSQVYSMSNRNDSGIELVSISLEDDVVNTIDVNSLQDNNYKLRPIQAKRNLLFLQPYVNEIERAEFSRDYLVYDYLGEMTDSEYWQQGEGFLSREFGVKPYIYQDKYMPDAAYYKGSVYINKYNDQISHEAFALAVFDRKDQLYWLGYDLVDTKVEFYLKQAISDGHFDMGPYSLSQARKITLNIDSTGFNHKREPIPHAWQGTSFYFALPYSTKLERLYRYDFDTNETILVEEYDRQRAKLMTATEEAVYMLKQDSVTLGLYRIVGDDVTLIDRLFSVDLQAGLKQLNGDIYYIGVSEAGKTASLYKWSTQEQQVMDMLADRNDLIPQSFSYFDARVFFTAKDKTTGSYELFHFADDGQSISKLELNNALSEPLDLIRYARGLYFQANNQAGKASLYSLTTNEADQFPTVEKSEAKKLGRQGHFYTSSFATSDRESGDVNVFVKEPDWLSYNQDKLQFEGFVPQKYWDLGQQEVTAIIDDGNLLSVVNYPLLLEEILSLPWTGNFDRSKPPARFGKKWSMKFFFRKNVDTDEPLIFDMKVIRADTGEEVDWLTYEQETQTISGFIPDLDMESLSLFLEVKVSRGQASDSEDRYFLNVLPLKTTNLVLTKQVIHAAVGSTTEYQVEYVTNSNSFTVSEFSIAGLSGAELPSFISIDESSGLLTIDAPADYSGGNVNFAVTAFSNSHGHAVYAEGEIAFRGSLESDTEKSGGSISWILLIFGLCLLRQHKL